jgi:hypothetical protein
VTEPGEGWFVVNAREASWGRRPGRGYSLPFEGANDFPQLGIELYVLGPGEPIGLYHWEANQEDFLVLSGEAYARFPDSVSTPYRKGWLPD